MAIENSTTRWISKRGWNRVVLTVALAAGSICLWTLAVPGAHAQTWTWIKGTNSIDPSGVYGTQGTAASANTPGGRDSGMTWKGSGGALYLFGGKGLDSAGDDGKLNDMWVYSASSGQWTWLKGAKTIMQGGTYGTVETPDPANTPGARVDAMTWTGKDGRFYLFGGEGYDSAGESGWLNDVWRYDPGTNQWTWLKGADTRDEYGTYGTQGTPDSANTPGGRLSASAWTYGDGKFYLFGGQGFNDTGNYGDLNDVWRYDPVTNQWTWLNGTTAVDQNGIYGTPGIPAPDNIPGSREQCASWLGRDGFLYLFGGYGLDNVGNRGWLNDLWRYNVTTNQWTWLTGPDVIGQAGTYGTLLRPASDNTPGARRAAMAWTSVDGSLYLFGGDGYDSTGGRSWLNDVWKYAPPVNLWIWMKGSNECDESAVYGTRGTPSPDNISGARHLGMTWTDTAGVFYLFGGEGYNGAASYGRLNDLWRIRLRPSGAGDAWLLY